MYTLATTTQFRKDYKLAKKRGCDIKLLEQVIDVLLSGASLPQKNRDHALHGNYEGFRECHVQPDWLLIYAIDNGRLILAASRTGTHSDLFSL
jgi:mRNA interferase YafQ